MLRFCSFWFYPSAAAILVYFAARVETDRSFIEYLWLVSAGLLLWTLLEYGLHRVVFHWSPSNASLRELVYQFHLAHHADPRNPNKIFVRPLFSIPLSALILSTLHAWTTSLFSAGGLMMGLWAGFLYYEWVHYSVHVRSRSHGVEWHRRRHFFHHFIDEKNCYGVTSPVWDVVFGTYKKL